MIDPSSIAAMAPRPPVIWRFLLAALSPPLLLIAMSAWLGYEYSVTENMRLQVRASSERRSEAASLTARIADAESNQRGYIITGDPTYLADYAPARVEVMLTFDKLRTAMAGDPEQARLIEQFRGLAVQKFAEMDSVIAERRVGGFDAAAAHVRRGDGQRLMHNMRAVSARMLRAAERERDELVASYRARVAADRTGLWIGIGVAGLALVATCLWIWRQRVARYRARLAVYSAAERNRSILESTIDAIVILTPDGSVETINTSASNMLGYRPEELEGRDVSVLITLPDQPAPFQERIGFVDGKLANPYLSDRRILHRDGHDIPVDLALGVMHLPDGDHIVASLRDISQRKRVERIKDDLMSTVSHELRTPLTSVVGALGLLRAGSAGSISPNAKRLVEIAENNSRRLIRLINDMLDIDRIQLGQLSLDSAPLDLRDVVRRACDGSEGLAASQGISIACDVATSAVMVTGDADRLLQVVTNLTSNAIRASPPNGTVTIRLTHDGHQAQVAVNDDGPGVPMEFRSRIFSRFERAEGEQGPGTGLGLAISREIVNRHEGTIRFEDRPGGGTRFAFVLDLRHEPGAKHSGDGPATPMCEDDADAAGALSQIPVAIGQHPVGRRDARSANRARQRAGQRE